MKIWEFPKTPWLSVEEYNIITPFNYDDKDGKAPFDKFEQIARTQITLLFGYAIQRVAGGTIADGYLEPTTPTDNTLYLKKPQQDILKLATGHLVEAMRTGWKPYYEMKQSFTINNGSISNTQSAYEYTDELDQLPKIVVMLLRSIEIESYIRTSGASFPDYSGEDAWIKLNQLYDTIVKLNKTYKINNNDIDAKTQAELNEKIIEAIEQITLGAVNTSLVSLEDKDSEIVEDTGIETQQEHNRQVIGRVKDIEVLPDGKRVISIPRIDPITNKPTGDIFRITIDPITGEVDFDGLKGTSFVLEDVGLLQSDQSAKLFTFINDEDEVITQLNGVGRLEVENLQVAENIMTSSLTINNSEAKKIVEIDEDTTDDKNDLHIPTTKKVEALIKDSEGKDRVNDDEVDLTALFGTGDITPKTLKEFLDWFILRINGGENQTNKLNLYFNDNGELELRSDTTPLMVISKDKVNFLNMGAELIGDSANDLSALNKSQITTLVNQLIASANLSQDTIFWEDKTITETTDANDNTTIRINPEPTQLFEIGGNTTGFVSYGTGQGYGVPTNIATNLLGFELAFGGEEFDTLLGFGGDAYWKEYLFIPTLTLNKPQDWTITHNIKDKNAAGEIYIKNQAILNLSYVLIEDGGEYKLELNEFVEYTIKHYNKDGTLNKTETGTQYLNDSSLTVDKQPLRIYIIGTGYTSTGSAVGDLSNYFTKVEADARYYQKSEVDSKLDRKVNFFTDIGSNSKPTELYTIGIQADEKEYFVNEAYLGTGKAATTKLGFVATRPYLQFVVNKDRATFEISYYGDYNGYYAIATKQNVDTPYRKVGGEKLWLKNLK